MNQLDRKLYELLGDKTLSEGCVVEGKVITDSESQESAKMILIKTHPYCYGYVIKSRYDGGTHNETNAWVDKPKKIKIIGHEPTLTDLHRYLTENYPSWEHWKEGIYPEFELISYDSTKSLMEQSDSTKEAIVALISGNQ